MITRRASSASWNAQVWDSLYGHMFIEDVRLTILPIGGVSRRNAAFDVKATPGGRECEDIINGLLGGASTYRDFPATVCDWLGDCATAVLSQEEVTYNLTQQDDQPDSLHIARVYEEPQRDRDDFPFARHAPRETVRASVIGRLPQKDLRAVRELRRSLVVAADPMNSAELMGMGGNGNTFAEGFEYDVFTEEEARVLARATAPFGWNARNTFHPKHGQNAFSYVHRELVFHRFKATLRRVATKCLNDCLAEAASLLDRECLAVEIVGLPGESDVEAALQRLAEGHTLFSDILDPFSH